MTVVGAPDVVVLKPVDVDVQPAVGVDVHVGNEEICHEPSLPPSFEYSPDWIVFGTSKSASSQHQLAVFLFWKMFPLFRKTYPAKLPERYFQQPWFEAVAANYSRLHFYYTKKSPWFKAPKRQRIKGTKRQRIKPVAERRSDGSSRHSTDWCSRADWRWHWACRRNSRSRWRRNMRQAFFATTLWILSGLYRIWNIKVLQLSARTGWFFHFEKKFVDRKLLLLISKE